jgi:hypothetical protein
MKANLVKVRQIAANRATGNRSTGILAFFATFPRSQRRANFTIAATRKPKGQVTPSMDDLFPLIFFR